KHLDISGRRRPRQARATPSHVAEGEKLPTVLMGDCNEWRNRGGGIHDFGEHHRLVDTGHSFHSRKPVARLDRIFASPDLEALDAGVHQSALAARASDHLPIWARFKPAG
ncbi:MAG: endonuclease/exonuclease/phosphatase family protein, partial [Sphingopyxis terrae]|nr:endonuclease/exonuclease/phosphatase family protein [Sphingopyxis terrae]